MDVNCPRCGEKIAEYSGQAGYKIPIESKYYTRIDGSKPEHGSATGANCPHCGAWINELEATLFAVDQHLRPASKRAQTEQYLAEKGNESAPDSGS